MIEAKARFENMSDEEYEIEEEEEEEENEDENEELPTQMPTSNIKQIDTNMSIGQKMLAKSAKKSQRKKRMKPTIGYAGDDRINVFESLESNNTDDVEDEVWEEKKHKI